MKRIDLLSRRDFLKKAVAIGSGALLEAMICNQAAGLVHALLPTPFSDLTLLAEGVALANAEPVQQPVAASAPTPSKAALYISNQTQIDDMNNGKWEGMFYLGSALVQRVAKQYNIPEDLIHALCFRESTKIPNNRSKVNGSYTKGAVGIAQIMWFHAREASGVLDLTDLPTNLIKMAQIFNAYRAKHDGDPDWVRKTLYDYNAGPNRKATSAATLQYAEDIIALWKNPRLLQEGFIDKAWCDLSLLYWQLLPDNPFREPFVRTGVDFGERYAGQPSHTGLDLGGSRIKIGTPIYAVADGKVLYTGKMYDVLGVPFSGRGNTVVLEHTPISPLVRNLKYVTTHYCHLSEFATGIAPGAMVERGQVIGYVGMTGWTTGPHLHFECAINTPINLTTRKMAREDGWFHPFRMLPPNQNYPGSKKLGT